MKLKTVEALILEKGALKAAVIPQDQIVLSREFRPICEKNSCGMFNRCWRCPPNCGDIDELMERVRSFPGGVLYQTVGNLEDSFDIEGMHETKQQHAQLSCRIGAALREAGCAEKMLHLGVGGCGLCEKCTMPEGKPCRHPEDALTSLEACGIDVYNTTKDTPLKYINGQNTVTYFGLVLLHED